MGDFGNGFVFTSAPDWEVIKSSIQPKFSLSGYQHRTENIWLLDIWMPSKREHWPFTYPIPDKLCIGVELPQQSLDAIKTLLKISSILSEENSGVSWLKNTASLAILTKAENKLGHPKIKCVFKIFSVVGFCLNYEISCMVLGKIEIKLVKSS